jgi:carboxyl-terminal processing protease
MTRKELLVKIRQLILILGVILVAGYGGYRYGLSRASFNFNAANPENVDLSNFWLVWNKLENKYLNKDKLDTQEMVDGAISGMVDSLDDPYTVYLPPDDNEVSQENLTGSFGGVGIRLGYKDRQLAVISPLKNTPADKAGIEAGDYILKIVDEDNGIDRTTEDITLPEAVKLIRGELGDKLTLTLSRQSRPEPFEVEIVRGEIEIPALETEWKSVEGKNIAYAHMLQFSERMNSEWDKWVKEINQRKNEEQFGGVVLDLRNNPGGYLYGAVYVAGEFLEKGKTVVWQEDYRGVKQKYEVERSGGLLDVPLVVLVNNGSASASEILAGALSHYQRATVVGQTTFGKGTIQEPDQLPNQAGLHITTAHWLLPDEESINEDGFQPEVVVELKEEEDQGEENLDLILEKGLEVINEKN